jgi:HEAT repeat protein
MGPAGNPFRYALIALVSSAALMAATMTRLKPTLFDRARPAGRITDDMARGSRWLRRLLFVMDPRRRARPIGPLTNPVMIKEFRSRRFGRSHWLLRLVALCAAGSLGLTVLSAVAALDWGPGTIVALLVILQGALILLLTPGLAAGLICAEIESCGWTLLQMTPLAPGRILRGKLLSVAWPIALILLATLPGYAMMMYAQPTLTQQLLDVGLCLLLTSVFALTLSAAVGSFFRRAAPATVAAYALLLGLCGGTFLVWLGRDSTFGHSLVEKVLTANPLAAALSIIAAPGFKQYHLVPACWWLMGIAAVACLIVLRIRIWQLSRPSCLLFLLCIGPGASASEVDFARKSDPRLEPVKKVAKFAPRLKSLWLEALSRPEADLKRRAAEAIARAHRLGMSGLADTAPRLVEELEAAGSHRVVRLAAAQALIALDARQAAPALMKFAQADDLDASRLVEPALARWDYAPIRPVWRARLEDSRSPRGLLKLAIEAAAAVRLSDAVPHLRRIALDPTMPMDVRLEAARSLAVLQTSGLEGAARPLAADDAPGRLFERLIAATLLAQHRGRPAEELLLRLAADREPAVAAIAVKRLLEIDPVLLDPLLGKLVKSSDTGLRGLAARALAKQATPNAAAALCLFLDDPDLELRISVRESLIRLADVEPTREAVRQHVGKLLTDGGRRAREQAVMAIGAIRFQPAADRLLQLLDDKAPEVSVPAAWALRRLAVPSTADAILARVRVQVDRGRRPLPPKPAPDPGASAVAARQLEHLIEALGVLRHRPAAPLLAEFLPPPPPPLARIRPGFSANMLWQNEMREAAIWSLGHIYAGEPVAGLAAPLKQCLGGTGQTNEPAAVRAIAAVSIGRMKMKDLLAPLRELHKDESAPVEVGAACAWALEQITGHPAPLNLKPLEVWHRGWFLEPLSP